VRVAGAAGLAAIAGLAERWGDGAFFVADVKGGRSALPSFRGETAEGWDARIVAMSRVGHPLLTGANQVVYALPALSHLSSYDIPISRHSQGRPANRCIYGHYFYCLQHDLL